MNWLWLSKTAALVGAELLGAAVVDFLEEKGKPKPVRSDTPQGTGETRRSSHARDSRPRKR